MRSLFLVFSLLMGSFASAAVITPFTPPKGKVSIQSPKNGATVSSPVKVVMKSTVKLRPAGEDPNDHMTGHHHLIVDGGAIPAGEVIPADIKHIHFGKGQSEAELTLTPGPHTLTIQLADGAHRSYGPTLSQKIHIIVK